MWNYEATTKFCIPQLKDFNLGNLLADIEYVITEFDKKIWSTIYKHNY